MEQRLLAMAKICGAGLVKITRDVHTSKTMSTTN